MSLGSVGNPSGFLALAVRPELPHRPATPLGGLVVLSFTATAVGYGGAAWSVAHAIVHRQYPEQVAGMVLLDAQPTEAFEGLPAYRAFYSAFRRISALLPSLARLGVGRLVPPDRALPEPARDIQRLHHSSPRLYRSRRDEFATLPTSLAQARSFQGLGDRPLVVVTATRDAQAGWLPLQDRMARLPTNSGHRFVPCTHAALVTDRTTAEASTQAIRDVVYAVRFATALTQS